MRLAIQKWVGGLRFDVEGDVQISADGSEYDVTLIRVRSDGRSYPPSILTGRQQEDVKDDLAEVVREEERKAGTLPYVVGA